MNILQRLAKVREQVSYLEKETKVDGKYKVVTHDQLTAATREHFVQAGIMVFPILQNAETQPTGTSTRSGAKYFLHGTVYTVRFMNVSDPKDFVDATVSAQGLDTGDKGAAKALSVAVRIAMLKVLMIQTGEDEEQRPEQIEETISLDQRLELFLKCEQCGWDPDAYLERLARSFSVEKIDDLPAKFFETAKRRIDGQHKRELEAGAA